MEKQEVKTNDKYLVTGKATHQVSNDEWERFTENIEVNKNTTVEEIFNWAKIKDVDFTTIQIYELNKIIKKWKQNF